MSTTTNLSRLHWARLTREERLEIVAREYEAAGNTQMATALRAALVAATGEEAAWQIAKDHITRPEDDMETRKTEWVAVLHGQTGTVKIAYRSPVLLAQGLAEQTAQGWVAAHVTSASAPPTATTRSNPVVEQSNVAPIAAITARGDRAMTTDETRSTLFEAAKAINRASCSLHVLLRHADPQVRYAAYFAWRLLSDADHRIVGQEARYDPILAEAMGVAADAIEDVERLYGPAPTATGKEG